MNDAASSHAPLARVHYEFSCDDGPSGEFRVYRMRFSEEINGDYDLDLDLVTDELTADTDLLLGAPCQLDISRDDHVRSVFGIVSSVDYIGRSEDRLFISARVVPAFYLLGQQTHSRIFQDMTVLEILQEVLGAELGQYGRTLDTGASSRGTTPRDYCVQYRESDMEFCIRLMEEEGISYHFVHSDEVGHEVLTLAYDNADYTEFANVDGTPVVPIIVSRADTAEIESIRNLELLQALAPTSVVRRDYDHATPLQLLESTIDAADGKGYTRRIYRHTDRRWREDDVDARARDHLEAAQARSKVARGSGNAIQFSAGRIFEIERHVRDDLETQFLITRVVHTGEAPDELLATSDGGGDGPRYTNSFQCIPLDVPMRPKQRHPKPRSHGPETAIVTGPSGEEIHVDAAGRIKVQFHWEEETTYDDTSSAWVRVRQAWAGPGWGFQFIPRIGMEVIVEFLGGDIERPIVTGTVYNGDNGYPYALPDNKTRSGIKTDSVSGDGSNELRFEDMSGSEEVYLHAQKDLTIETDHDKNQTTGHDETLAIANDRTKDVGHDEKETIGNDKTIEVQGEHTETIAKDMKLEVRGNRRATVIKDDTLTITGEQTITITKSRSTTVAAKVEETIGGLKAVKIGGAHTELVGGARSIAAGAAIELTAGAALSLQSAAAMAIGADDELEITSTKDATIHADAKMEVSSAKAMTFESDKTIVIEAADQITLKAGGAKIVLKKSGEITISGKKINIKGSGPVAIKGSKADIN